MTSARVWDVRSIPVVSVQNEDGRLLEVNS